MPGHSPQPSVTHAALVAGLEQHLHPHADAEHRAAAGQPPAMISGPPTARSPAMQAANAPDAGDDEPVGLLRVRADRR